MDENDLSSTADSRKDTAALVELDGEGRTMVRCVNAKGESKTILLEQIISYVFTALKNSAEVYLGQKPMKGVNVVKPDKASVADRFVNDKPVARVHISRVVIGVPANYSKNQKDMTRTAAKMAGNK